MQFLGVDTGGTFTDFVLLEASGLHIHKRLSTPAKPEQAIFEGINALGLDAAVTTGKLTIIHGSTVATNAALERKGVKTVFITNRGFKDMLTIGRQNRPELYNLTPKTITPPVPKELCLETGGRLDATGQCIEPLTDDDIEQLVEQIKNLQPEAAAINLLFSFLDATDESRLEKAIEPLCHVSRSSEVLAEYKEYERGIATWLNAWLGPIVKTYLHDLEDGLSPCNVSVMQSSGGTISAQQARKKAVNLLLSGPAGGLAAAQYLGEQTGINKILTFDMGGTSTDVSLIDGGISLTSEGRVAGYPVAIPMVNMHTIGAGGGSIASLDDGGALQVGPASAGSDPGPACYGNNGEYATVTDANVVLGKLGNKPLLGGYLSLDIDASHKAIQTLADKLALSVEETAQGIITIANEHMAAALRVISIEKGADPADFVLCCFGGAGGLHLCQIAESLNINNAIIPIHGGVFSALGMLVAPKKREMSRTINKKLNEVTQEEIESFLNQLRNTGIAELLEESVLKHNIVESVSLDMRYIGQSFTLNIPYTNSNSLEQEFHQAHLQCFGHEMPLACEIVNIRLSLKVSQSQLSLPAIDESKSTIETLTSNVNNHKQAVENLHRETMPLNKIYHGPLIIVEDIATTFVETGWQVYRDDMGNLHLNISTTL